MHNEADRETDIKRTQIYMVNTLAVGGLIAFSRLAALSIIGFLSGWKRYD